MFKKLSKAIFTLILSVVLLTVGSGAGLASSNGDALSAENSILTNQQLDNTVNSLTNITDYQTIYETITGGKTYNINVSDLNQRNIFIGSTGPIKVIIYSQTFSTNIVYYDSGYPRIGNKVTWNFVPGVDYQLLVIPQNGATAININMVPAFDSSWITFDNYTIQEKNIIFNNQYQIYDVNFNYPGTYKVTVSTGINNLVATVQTVNGFRETVLIRGQHSFTFYGQPTGNIQDHKIILVNTDPSAGGAYTLTIDRVN